MNFMKFIVLTSTRMDFDGLSDCILAFLLQGWQPSEADQFLHFHDHRAIPYVQSTHSRRPEAVESASVYSLRV